MHLKFDERFLSVVFFSSVIFLLCFFVLTLVDVRSRADVLDEQDNFVLRDERAAAKKIGASRAGGAPEQKSGDKPGLTRRAARRSDQPMKAQKQMLE